MVDRTDTDAWNQAPKLAPDGWWHMHDYHDIKRALRDPRFSSVRSSGTLETTHGSLQEWFSDALLPGRASVKWLRGHWIVFNDAPDHTRLRAILQPIWTARLIQARPRIERKVASLLDQAEQSREIHALTDVTMPLPTQTISEMLGLPEDAPTHFRAWFREQDTLFGWNEHPSREGFAQAGVVVEYYRQVVRAHHAQPKDDLISDLIRAQAQGAPLSDAELIAIIIELSIAGFRTLERTLMNGITEYARTPHAFTALTAVPHSVPLAVEEILRRSQNISFVHRTLTTDISMGGTLIPRGARFTMDVDVADYDPTIFHAPHELDLLRRSNPHLKFGLGAHFCIGAPLARMQAQALFQELIRRAPSFEPVDEPSYRSLKSRDLPYDLQLRW